MFTIIYGLSELGTSLPSTPRPLGAAFRDGVRLFETIREESALRPAPFPIAHLK